jgi:hypothetical protein
MALAMNATLLVSCESSEEQSGPTIVHSTGVENYRVQPEIIRILQESCSNQKLSDHEKGVQCVDPPAHIIDTFKAAGFTVTSTSTADSRKIWMLTKTGEGGAGHSTKPTEKKDEEPADDGNGDEAEEEDEK